MHIYAVVGHENKSFTREELFSYSMVNINFHFDEIEILSK